MEAVPNPHTDISYEVTMVCPEFTCLCPRTGQPDFATITVTYIPGPSIVELKSFKQYLWTYREQGLFHEDVTNRILKDLVATLHPRFMEVEGDFYVRGGIHTTVRSTFAEDDDV